MRIGLLGPPEVFTDEGKAARLSGRKVRILFAALACRPNRPVSVEALIEAMWGAEPPAQAPGNLRVYVHHLRKALGGARVERRGDGYALRVESGERDVDRFNATMGEARDAVAHGQPERAGALIRAALACWRGPALDGLASLPFFSAIAVGLEEQRRQAMEQRFEADLAAGRHNEIIAELAGLVERDPLSETFRAQLIEALAGAGRGAEAITVFEDGRRLLADELGLDPGVRLREAHLVVLRGDTAATSPAPPSPTVSTRTDEPVPRQLPARVAGFVGRAEALRLLDAMVPGGDESDQAMPVAVISGPAGIGKTTLALQWSHRAARSFPDGQLYLNLRGFDPTGVPVEPVAALDVLLNALGVRGRRLPDGQEAKENLYRSILAGRHVLVFLDNAYSATQVRPLLPGTGGCLVLVTSRNPLAGMLAAGARPVRLDPLEAAEARELLDLRLGSERVATEPEAVQNLIERCGRLPLALGIVAARAAVVSESPLSALADELGRPGATLAGFAAGGDETVDLRAVFSWSYRVLTRPAARMFRLLALHPGPDVTVWAAASVAGVAVPEAQLLLRELQSTSLLTEMRPGRYVAHDLLRAYAEEMMKTVDTAADREAALRRFFSGLAQTAHAATVLLDPDQAPITVDECWDVAEVISTRAEALAWFDAERAVILAAVDRARTGFEPFAWQLAYSAVVYLERSGRWQDKLTVLAAAAEAAERVGDKRMQALCLRSMGRTFGRLYRYDEAYLPLREAHDLFKAVGDLDGQAHTCLTLGEVLEHEGRYAEALEADRKAHDLYQAAGNPVGQARSLGGLASQHVIREEYEQSVSICRQALDLFLAVGNHSGAAGVYDTLGVAFLGLNRHDDAVDSFRRALGELENSGEQFYVALVLTNLGDAHRSAGDRRASREAYCRALEIFTAIQARETESVREKLDLVDRETPIG